MNLEKASTLNSHIQIQSPEAMGLTLEIAGIGARSHAFIIDWHIRLLLAISWILGCGIALFSFQGMQSAWEHASTGMLYLWLGPAGVIYFFYHPVLEIIMSGRTPGKRMAGVKIVTNKGLTPGAGALLIRNVFRLLDSLPAFYLVGLGAVALTRHQVRIGDMAAGLMLVYSDEINKKELHQASQLALKSDLSPADQALLLDLLKRWPQMQIEDRIRLGEKFLARTGSPVPTSYTEKKQHDKQLLEQLEKLAETGKR